MRYSDEPAWIGELQGSVLSPLWVGVSARGLVAVHFPASLASITQQLTRMGFQDVIPDAVRTQPAISQIREYLEGRRRSFDLPIDWSVMTPFQQQVLHFTVDIPYGQTATYSAIAKRVGRPRAARAVGRAQATNPLPLVIPCHRVLGTDGRLHGYGAGNGLATKAWLLELERANTVG